MVSKVLLLFVYACLLLAPVCHAGCGTFVGSTGNKYYLDALTKSTDYTGKETSAAYTYWYNYCQNIDKSKTGTSCTADAPAVQVSGTGQCMPIGFIPPVITELSGKNGVQLVYTNNIDLCGNPKTIPRVATFTLTCNSNTEYELEPGTCQYAFAINTKYACAGTIPPPTPAPEPHKGGGGGGLSPGSIFLIIFFCALAAYFLVGVVVKWRVYNAAGVEMVPNVELWLGLPGLIRDGFLFVKNKITGAAGYSSL